jgi:hypothetical protein
MCCAARGGLATRSSRSPADLLGVASSFKFSTLGPHCMCGGVCVHGPEHPYRMHVQPKVDSLKANVVKIL